MQVVVILTQCWVVQIISASTTMTCHLSPYGCYITAAQGSLTITFPLTVRHFASSSKEPDPFLVTTTCDQVLLASNHTTTLSQRKLVEVTLKGI